MCCVVVEGFGEQGEGGDAPQGSRRPRGGCHRELGHMHCGSAGPWQASASCRLRKGCPGAMSSTRTIQSWRGAPMGSCCARGRRGPSVVPTRPVQIHSTVRELEYRLRAMPAGLGPSVRFHPTTRLPDARQSSSLPAWLAHDAHLQHQLRLRALRETDLVVVKVLPGAGIEDHGNAAVRAVEVPELLPHLPGALGQSRQCLLS